MPKVEHAPHKDGDCFVNYENKVFEDVKAQPSEKALITFHTVANEGSVGFVNLLQATRLIRKGLRDVGAAVRAGYHPWRAAWFPPPRR